MRERKNWADIAKGIGVFLVVLGHMPTISTIIRAWIFSFHMPLFYFLSGYFYCSEEHAILRYVGKQAKATLIPYLYFSVVFIVLDYFIIQNGEQATRIKIWNTLIGQGGNDILWFFVSLFWVKTIFHVLRKAKGYRYLLAVIVTANAYLLMNGIAAPLKIGTSIMAVAFYWSGYELKAVKWKGNPVFRGMLFGIVNLIISFYAISCTGIVMDINHGVYSGFAIVIAAGVCGSLAVCEFSRILQQQWLPIKAIAYIGKNSKYFYPLTGYISNMAIVLLQNEGVQVGAAVKLMTKGVSFLVTWGITEVANRIPKKQRI